MKKFSIKKSAKYIVCTLLTLTVVATVVFLPRFYYSVTDSKDSIGNTAETFKLTADKTALSGGEFLKLISSEDTVWVLKNSTQTQDVLVDNSREAIKKLADSLDETELFSGIASYIPKYMTDNNGSVFEYTVRGTLDGSDFVSADFSFANFLYAEEGEPYGISMTMLFDPESRTVYELNIDATIMAAAVSESENPLYSIIPYDDNYNQRMTNALIKYWGVSSDSITVNITPDSFSINIYSMPFLEYSRINNNLIEY